MVFSLGAKVVGGALRAAGKTSQFSGAMGVAAGSGLFRRAAVGGAIGGLLGGEDNVLSGALLGAIAPGAGFLKGKAMAGFQGAAKAGVPGMKKMTGVRLGGAALAGGASYASHSFSHSEHLEQYYRSQYGENASTEQKLAGIRTAGNIASVAFGIEAAGALAGGIGPMALTGKGLWGAGKAGVGAITAGAKGGAGLLGKAYMGRINMQARLFEGTATGAINAVRGVNNLLEKGRPAMGALVGGIDRALMTGGRSALNAGAKAGRAIGRGAMRAGYHATWGPSNAVEGLFNMAVGYQGGVPFAAKAGRFARRAGSAYMGRIRMQGSAMERIAQGSIDFVSGANRGLERGVASVGRGYNAARGAIGEFAGNSFLGGIGAGWQMRGVRGFGGAIPGTWGAGGATGYAIGGALSKGAARGAGAISSGRSGVGNLAKAMPGVLAQAAKGPMMGWAGAARGAVGATIGGAVGGPGGAWAGGVMGAAGHKHPYIAAHAVGMTLGGTWGARARRNERGRGTPRGSIIGIHGAPRGGINPAMNFNSQGLGLRIHSNRRGNRSRL
jgi:hypothetical protein